MCCLTTSERHLYVAFDRKYISKHINHNKKDIFNMVTVDMDSVCSLYMSLSTTSD
jgi:hypothetical protein